MDYEKKYKEALRQAEETIKYYKERNRDEAAIEDLQEIFPELKESEDELTWLTKYIEEEAYWLSLDIRDDEDRIKLKKLQESLAWLKKQDSQILANSTKTCKDEQKPAWSEEDEEHYNACLNYFEEIKPDSVYYKDYLWLKSLKERINV